MIFTYLHLHKPGTSILLHCAFIQFDTRFFNKTTEDYTSMYYLIVHSQKIIQTALKLRANFITTHQYNQRHQYY